MRLMRVCAAIAALCAPLIPLQGVTAQAPLFGTDSAVFRLSLKISSSLTLGSDSMVRVQSAEVLARIHITAAGRDTLRVYVLIDSVADKVERSEPPGALPAGAGLSRMSKGDSAVSLVTTRGTLIRLVSGKEEVRTAFAFNTDLPVGAAAGATWQAKPPLHAFNSMIPEMMSMHGSGSRQTEHSNIRLEGLVERAGARAWRFTSSTSLRDASQQPHEPDFMRGSGEFFVDVRGRLIYADNGISARADATVQVNSVRSEISTHARLERIGSQTESAGILRASAEYVSREWLKGALNFDPRVLQPGPPLAPAATLLHSDALLTAVAVPGTVAPITLEKAARCNNVTSAECKTDGRAAILMLSEPDMRGDTALVRSFIRTARTPTAQDSAQARSMKSPRDSTYLFSRLSRATATAADITLVKSGSTWKVITFRITGQS